MPLQTSPTTPKIPHYDHFEEIGTGGMGTVYRARHTSTGDIHALKTLRMNQARPEEREELRARFAREARLAMNFDHPQLVKVYDFFSYGDNDYLAMEYLEGDTLKNHLAGRLIRSGQHVIPFMIQACEGLQYAHDQGIIHRDIKPDNLFVTQKNNTLKIMDFGIARQNNAEQFLSHTQPGLMLGTLNYMSPEQLQDTANVDPRTDIFSLGVVMYELFTGVQPFAQASMGQTMLSILSENPASPHTLNPRLPQALSEIIEKCLSKRRGQRYQCARDLSNALREIEASQTPLPSIKTASGTGQSTGQNTGPINTQTTRPTPVNYQDYIDPEVLTTRQFFHREMGLSLQCQSDGMGATLSYDPTYATRQLTPEAIQNWLAEHRVVYGIKQDMLASLCARNYFEDVSIATGTPPQMGQDAFLEKCWQEPVPGPAVAGDGSVNHRELNQWVSVKVGDVVARKHPLIQGTPGITIYGEPVPVLPVKDFTLKENKGTCLDPEDPHVLLATTAGTPVSLHQSVQVVNVLELEAVNARTGNVRFEGAVIVHGDIDKGFLVHAGGDLVVYGSVESSRLVSEGHMYLHQPVYNGSHLKAKFNVHARFLQGVDLECGGDLRVQKGLFHCQIRATGKVLMGPDSYINGGEVYSTYWIEACKVGSEAGHQTRLAVGRHPSTQWELEKVQEQQTQIQNKLKNNIKDMLYARTHQQDHRLAQLEQSRSQLLFQVNTLNDEVSFLEQQLARSEKPTACVIYARDFCGDVHTNLCGSGRSFAAPETGPFRLRQVARGLRQFEVEINYGATAPVSEDTYCPPSNTPSEHPHT